MSLRRACRCRRRRRSREVFAEALRGRPVHGGRAGRRPRGAAGPRAGAATPTRADLALLAHCTGRTLDIGCGPGRLTAALAALGHVVLGIDVVQRGGRPDP